MWRPTTADGFSSSSWWLQLITADRFCSGACQESVRDGQIQLMVWANFSWSFCLFCSVFWYCLEPVRTTCYSWQLFLILWRTCTWRPFTAHGFFLILCRTCTWRPPTADVFFLFPSIYNLVQNLCVTTTYSCFLSNLVQNLYLKATYSWRYFFLLILCRTCTWRPATTGKAVSCTMTTFWPVTTARLSTSPPPALTAKSSFGTWRPRRCLPDCARANPPTCRWREGKGRPIFVPMDICPMGKISLCLRGTSSVTATCYTCLLILDFLNIFFYRILPGSHCR